MENEIEIVRYQSEQRQKVIEFLKSIAIDEFGFIEWKDYLERKDFSSYEKGESIFLVALFRGEIVGTAGGLRKDERTIKLNSMYVKKEHRSQKLGTRLFEMVEDFAKKNKYRRMILCTFDRFDIAKKFYDKLGFSLYERDGIENWCEKEIKRTEEELYQDFLSIEKEGIVGGKYSAKSDDFLSKIEKFQEGKICSRFEIKPIQFTFEITNLCNCHCPHCGMSANSKTKKSRLGETDLKEISSSLEKAGILSYAITGGEPFLEFSNLCKFISFSKGKLDAIKLISNGFWGKDSKAYFEKLDESGFFENRFVVPAIQISIGEQDTPLEYVCNIIEYATKSYKPEELHLGIIYTKVPNERQSKLETLYETYEKKFGAFPVQRIYLTVAEYKNYVKSQEKLDVESQSVFESVACCDNNFCTEMGKFVSPKIFMKTTGECYPCEIFNMHEDMYLGNFFEDGIEKILESYNKNKYVKFIKKYGTIGFRDVIPKHILENKSAETPCMACEFCIKYCEKNNLIK